MEYEGYYVSCISAANDITRDEQRVGLRRSVLSFLLVLIHAFLYL